MAAPAITACPAACSAKACILKDLLQRGHEVIAFVADVGQQGNFQGVAEGARQTRASKVIFPAIAGNAI